MGDSEDEHSTAHSIHADDLPGHMCCQFRYDRLVPVMGRVHRWSRDVFCLNGLSGLRKGGLTMEGPMVATIVFLAVVSVVGLVYARRHREKN